MPIDLESILGPPPPAKKEPLDLSAILGPPPVTVEKTQPVIDLKSILGEPPQKVGVGEAIGAGVAEAIDPFGLLSKSAVETGKKEKEVGGIAAQAVANLGTNIAAGLGAAAAGGAIAGPVGALLGPIVYGVYQGFGREYIRSTIEGRDPSVARGLALSALEVNPLVKSGTKLMKVLRAAGQVVGEGAVEYSYDKNTKAAALASGLGLLGGAAILKTPLSAKPSPNMAAKLADDFSNSLTMPEGRDLLMRVAERSKTDLVDLPAEIPIDFKKWYLQMEGEKAGTVNTQWKRKTKNLSKENLQEYWNIKQTQDILLDESKKMRQSLSSEIAANGLQDNTSGIGRTLKDAKFIARDADAVTGLNIEGTLDLLSLARNKHDTITGTEMRKILPTVRLAKKLKLNPNDIGYALDGLDDKISPAGRAILATPKGQEVLQGYRTAFDDARKIMRANGYDVGELSNYLPMYSLKGAELAGALDTAKVKLNDGMVKYNIPQGPTALVDLRKAATKAGDTDLLNTLVDLDAIYNNANFPSWKKEKTGLTKLDEIDVLIGSALGQGDKKRIGYEASAAMSRRGDMPELMRNYNVNELYLQYINGNLKAVNFDKPLRQLESVAQALKVLGMEETHKYFTTLGKQIAGAESVFMADINRRIRQASFTANKVLANNPTLWDKMYYGTVKNLPDIHNWAAATVYPSYLGLNVRAGLRNLTQPLMVTSPELGAYGYKLAAKTPKHWYTAATNPQQVEQLLLNKGLISDRFHGEEIVKEGMLQSGLPGRTVDAFNKIAMWGYGKTDVINRYVTWNMAQEWAQDIAKGNKAALKALDQLSTGAKAQLKANDIRPTDTARLGEFLGKYLIAKTQFHYGKEQLSQFGREYGKMVSMFTKWPAMIGSDIVEMYKTRGVGKGTLEFAQKYMAPLGILMSIDHMARESREKPSTGKYLFGELSSYSPLSAVKGLSEGQLGSPLIRMGLGAIGGGIGAIETASKGPRAVGLVGRELAREMGASFIPIASPVINEIDKIRKNMLGKPKISDILLNEAGFPRKNN